MKDPKSGGPPRLSARDQAALRRATDMAEVLGMRIKPAVIVDEKAQGAKSDASGADDTEKAGR